MSKNCYVLTLVLVSFAIVQTSCNQYASKYSRLVEERDSLRLENEIQARNLNTFVEMIDTINSVLDSISLEEGMLFLTPTKEVKYAKNKTLRDLERFELVLRHQQRKIDELDSLLSLSDYNKQTSMRILIDNLKLELEKKDVQISKLRNEISRKDLDISRLRKEVEEQKNTISSQEETISDQIGKLAEQENVIARQDEMMNNCFILIASGKELSEKGITAKKKLFKEVKLLDNKEFDESYFQKVDIRQCTEISFKAKNPRVLTNMPRTSYVLEKINKGEYILTITSPSSFWSISNYLVIQTD